MTEDQPKLYTELAGWWQLISPTEDYADEAAFFAGLFRAGNAETLLELGSGGGNVAWFLKEEFSPTLTDISPDMLVESRKQNPDLEHVEGDMRSLRLGRTFDGVLIHDAIMYMLTEEDLRAAFTTAHEHCKPSGTVVIAPDYVSETFRPETSHGGTDGDGRAVRYMEWTWDSDVEDTEINYEFILALREGPDLRTVVDRQVTGIFPRETWLRLLRDVGFQARSIEDPSSGGERAEVFLGHKR